MLVWGFMTRSQIEENFHLFWKFYFSSVWTLLEVNNYSLVGCQVFVPSITLQVFPSSVYERYGSLQKKVDSLESRPGLTSDLHKRSINSTSAITSCCLQYLQSSCSQNQNSLSQIWIRTSSQQSSEVTVPVTRGKIPLVKNSQQQMIDCAWRTMWWLPLWFSSP